MSLRKHFETRAAELADLADLAEPHEHAAAVRLTLTPKTPAAVGVVLYLLHDRVGTVKLDDQASVPAELGDDDDADRSAIDQTIDVAVYGRATAFHLGRGGCIEERDDAGHVTRTWMNALPWPGWRRRATRIEYAPYR